MMLRARLKPNTSSVPQSKINPSTLVRPRFISSKGERVLRFQNCANQTACRTRSSAENGCALALSNFPGAAWLISEALCALTEPKQFRRAWPDAVASHR